MLAFIFAMTYVVVAVVLCALAIGICRTYNRIRYGEWL